MTTTTSEPRKNLFVLLSQNQSRFSVTRDGLISTNFNDPDVKKEIQRQCEAIEKFLEVSRSKKNNE